MPRRMPRGEDRMTVIENLSTSVIAPGYWAQVWPWTAADCARWTR